MVKKKNKVCLTEREWTISLTVAPFVCMSQLFFTMLYGSYPCIQAALIRQFILQSLYTGSLKERNNVCEQSCILMSLIAKLIHFTV